MHSGHIAGATKILGAPKEWDKSAHGPCGSLPVRVEKTTAGMGMTSAWYPTSEELGRIMAGAPIYLTIIGDIHPPVAMSVGAPPDAAGPGA